MMVKMNLSRVYEVRRSLRLSNNFPSQSRFVLRLLRETNMKSYCNLQLCELSRSQPLPCTKQRTRDSVSGCTGSFAFMSEF